MSRLHSTGNIKMFLNLNAKSVKTTVTAALWSQSGRVKDTHFLNCPRSSVAERQRGYYYHSVVTVPKKKKKKRTAALKDEQ